jgi:hypothetical protein
LKVEDTAKLSTLERYIWWIVERHCIHLKKERGEKKPWTENEILRDNFFTNAYRELDKTTRWYSKNVREARPFRGSTNLIFATIAFRRYSWPEAGQRLLDGGYLLNWDGLKVKEMMSKWDKVCNGAFFTSTPKGMSKAEGMCYQIDQVWRAREEVIIQVMRAANRQSIQRMTSYLTGLPGIGKFMAYEIACDFRWSFIGKEMRDVDTWCNPGPGAIRGYLRVHERDFYKSGNVGKDQLPVPSDFYQGCSKLLEYCRANLPSSMPKFEMREVEHSLCEFDKFERIRLGEGKARRRYNGRG